MLLKIISIQLVWLACIGVYLSSKQQAFLPKPLPKWSVWVCFSVAVVVSFCFLVQLYHSLTAGLFILLVMMFAWILMALVVPHYPKAKVVFSAGTLLMLGISLMDGSHVG